MLTLTSQKSFFSWKLAMENQLMKTADFLCLTTARTSSSLQLLSEKNPTSCLQQWASPENRSFKCSTTSRRRRWWWNSELQQQHSWNSAKLSQLMNCWKLCKTLFKQLLQTQLQAVYNSWKKLLQTLEEAVENSLQGKALSATTVGKKILQTLLKQQQLLQQLLEAFTIIYFFFQKKTGKSQKNKLMKVQIMLKDR